MNPKIFCASYTMSFYVYFFNKWQQMLTLGLHITNETQNPISIQTLPEFSFWKNNRNPTKLSILHAWKTPPFCDMPYNNKTCHIFCHMNNTFPPGNKLRPTLFSLAVYRPVIWRRGWSLRDLNTTFYCCASTIFFLMLPHVITKLQNVRFQPCILWRHQHKSFTLGIGLLVV